MQGAVKLALAGREKVSQASLASFLRTSCLSVSASLVISVLSVKDPGEKIGIFSGKGKGLGIHSEEQKFVTKYHSLSTESEWKRRG